MEFQRRMGHGRLPEIFGAATLPQDRFLRTVGFGRAARAAWEGTPERAKQQVNAYVSGVNAFLSSHHGTDLPLEFSLLRFEPEAWSGPDVIVWIKMLAWDLSADYSLELLRHDLVRAVGVERMAALMPPYARHGLSILGGSSKPVTTEDTAETAEKTKTDLTAVSIVSSAVESSWSGTFAAGLSQGPRAVRGLLIGS